MEVIKAQNARLQKTLDHDSLFGELRDEMVRLGKGMKKDVKDVDEKVQERMKKIHEELSRVLEVHTILVSKTCKLI